MLRSQFNPSPTQEYSTQFNGYYIVSSTLPKQYLILYDYLVKQFEVLPKPQVTDSLRTYTIEKHKAMLQHPLLECIF
jgi:hypothetical protein